MNFITLSVEDLAASRRFYVDGLGWQPVMDNEGIVMVPLSPTLVLSLWAADGFEEEVGPIRRGDGIVGITLAHNLPTPQDVDRVLAEAVAAGAVLTGPAQQRVWGGYSGYFADPDGYRWEVAYNPDPVGVELMVNSGLLDDPH